MLSRRQKVDIKNRGDKKKTLNKTKNRMNALKNMSMLHYTSTMS